MDIRSNMTIRRPSLVRWLVFMAVNFTATECLAQADPAWLKSWNEAEQQRPVTLSSRGRIATEDEPGIPLVIHGRVVTPNGTSARRVVVHAYHRDRDGFDFGSGDNTLTTWRLQGWVVTDTEGRFEFRTIRPAPDHLGRDGAHIHITLESVDFGRQWAPTVFFADDPLVSADQRRRSIEAAEFGWVRDVRTTDGVQHVDVSIRLKEKADF